MANEVGKSKNCPDDVVYCDVFMRAAIEEAKLALAEGEVPVGCVFVHVKSSCTANTDLQVVDDLIVARGRNATNRERHALAHAEFVAVEQLLQDVGGLAKKHHNDKSEENSLVSLSDYVLYVVVEPCVMCAAMLLYNRVRKVFFGCRNPRFGGNGTVAAIQDWHGGRISMEMENGGGGSGSRAGMFCGYESCGGYRAEEAVELLQQFYRHENRNAPPGKRKRKET
ncbi:putative deaminase [Trypanosoma vivax]|nr:putative deaminase [Trypanosoma vivax]